MREILNVNKRLIYLYKLHKSTGAILLRVLGMIKVVLQGHANYFLTFHASLVFRLLAVVGVQ